jgi:hypothetical protein
LKLVCTYIRAGTKEEAMATRCDASSQVLRLPVTESLVAPRHAWDALEADGIIRGAGKEEGD